MFTGTIAQAYESMYVKPVYRNVRRKMDTLPLSMGLVSATYCRAPEYLTSTFKQRIEDRSGMVLIRFQSRYVFIKANRNCEKVFTTLCTEEGRADVVDIQSRSIRIT
eukprot:TRINITY_DN4949_c0_g1_i1.p2 TRINITY_DN4949_c0_g1~~TRINITY_DN4949_c0_g1_i1.p2  ORF type:complete len:107 (-),score=4.02 TRINITY_DN4949_c0_g1_i1:291-611(-)